MTGSTKSIMRRVGLLMGFARAQPILRAGRVKEYKERFEIILNDPAQLKVK
jgi:hypothetical protein